MSGYQDLEKKTWARSDRPIEWSPEVIERLKCTRNPISREVDFWLNSLLEGFVTEFVVDTQKAYSEVERYFFKGYRGKYLNSLNL